jgi:NADH-quinone oxidoreductase subunit H
MKLLLFLIAEFLHMVVASFLIVILFFGGWHFWGMSVPADNAVTWPEAILRVAVLAVKVLAVILFFMLVRWSWPRFRFDQLMNLAWKVMLPLGLLNLLTVACVLEYAHGRQAQPWPLGPAVMIGVGWGVALAAWIAAALLAPLHTDNRPRLEVLGPPPFEPESMVLR